MYLGIQKEYCDGASDLESAGRVGMITGALGSGCWKTFLRKECLKALLMRCYENENLEKRDRADPGASFDDGLGGTGTSAEVRYAC